MNQTNRPFHNNKKESYRDSYSKFENLLFNALRNTNENASNDKKEGKGIITATYGKPEDFYKISQKEHF